MTTEALPQNMQALELANAVRLERSAIVRALRRGELLFADLDLTSQPLANMQALTLLQNLQWSRGCSYESDRKGNATRRPMRALREAGVSPTAKVGALTQRQRDALKFSVARVCPTQREES